MLFLSPLEYFHSCYEEKDHNYSNYSYDNHCFIIVYIHREVVQPSNM